MADEVTEKVIEQCQVSPPPPSLPSVSVPLSYLDIPWLYLPPVKHIFFYDFPYPTQHFLQTLLPNLKHSLSLTLQHFFPFAANVLLPPKPQPPHILYSPGDSAPFTVVESTADFTRFVSDSPRDLTDEYPFAPLLPSPTTLQDGTLLVPTMAIQVTVFANSGLIICVAFRHEVADGKSFHHFMKFWASTCRSTTGDSHSASSSLPLPLHNRDMIEDPKGLKPIFLEQMWNRPPPFTTQSFHDAATDMVRHRFILSRHQVEKLKKWVAVRCESIGLETLHLSTFTVTVSLFWVCKVKSEDTDVCSVPDNEDCYCFCFPIDWRNRDEVSIPSTYFGNCLTNSIVTLHRSKIMGENGICEAVHAIGSQIRGLKGDPLKGADGFMSGSNSRELMKWFQRQRVTLISGSPKFNVYQTDFGWGKPRLRHSLHDSATMCPSDCREEEHGIEVALLLKRAQMKKTPYHLGRAT
ncbi:Transferase [Sesbania bispinosa]|nr:Transferase [Sesbania bispinosa]